MNDYCDRCGALARARFIFPNGQDLVFCGHHAYEYKPVLINYAEEIVLEDDLTPTLLGV